MVPRRNIVKDCARILFWYPVKWFVKLVPFSLVCWIGNFFGYMDYLFSGSERINKMINNISQVFEEDKKALRNIVKKNLQNHCRNVLEFIKYPQLNRKNLSDILLIEGIDILNRELSREKGVILVTAHFGAKQILQIGLGLKGYKLNQICYHMDRDELSFIQKNVSQRQRIKIEEKIPVNFISAKSFMRSAYRCLRENQILIIAADGIGIPKYMNKGYTQFTFLGKRVLFPTNMSLLAKKTGSSVLPAFVIRGEGIKHKIVIEQPIGTNSRLNEDTINEFVKILERYVLRFPYLWEFWEEFEEGTLIEVADKKTSTETLSL